MSLLYQKQQDFKNNNGPRTADSNENFFGILQNYECNIVINICDIDVHNNVSNGQVL